MHILLIVFLLPVTLVLGFLFARFVVQFFIWIVLLGILTVAGVWTWTHYQEKLQAAAYEASPAQQADLQLEKRTRISDERRIFWEEVSNLPDLIANEKAQIRLYSICGSCSLSKDEWVHVADVAQKATQEGKLNVSAELAEAGFLYN